MSSLSSIGRVLLSESAHSSGIEALLFLFFGLIFGIFGKIPERNIIIRKFTSKSIRKSSKIIIIIGCLWHREKTWGTRGRGPRTLLLLLLLALMPVFSAFFPSARRLLRRVPLPYTCILLIWGLIFGIIQNAVGDGNGYHYMYQGFEYWHAMSPTLVLGVFLPILIFASGFSLDWHTVKRLKWQVLLLAGPGVIVGTILTAVVFKYVVPASVIPDINWNEALLYGAIFSATDPVAVVAVLKEVGASKDLGTLIEGESLLNDGTAYVFFIIFLARVEGHEDKAAKLVATFCQLALGGPATGLLFGIVTAYLLKHIYNDELAEVTLTISASFLCYFVADDLFKVSGVLALVFLGIYMVRRVWGSRGQNISTIVRYHVIR
jgi:NhaP-type Na+/H+ or K+/H+ antiporter